MPIKVDGIEYLNTTESAAYLGWNIGTFKKWLRTVKRYVMPGKPGIYYRKDDLDQFKNVPPQEIPPAGGC